MSDAREMARVQGGQMAKLAMLARQCGALQAQKQVAEKLGFSPEEYQQLADRGEHPSVDPGFSEYTDEMLRRPSSLHRLVGSVTGAGLGTAAGMALARRFPGSGAAQGLRRMGAGIVGGGMGGGTLGAMLGHHYDQAETAQMQRELAQRLAQFQNKQGAAGIDLAALLAKRAKGGTPSIASVAGHAGLPAMAQAAAARRPPPVAKASIQQMLAGKHAAATCEHGCPMSGDCSKCGRCEHGKTPSGDCKLSHGKMASDFEYYTDKDLQTPDLTAAGTGVAGGMLGAAGGGLAGLLAGKALGGFLAGGIPGASLRKQDMLMGGGGLLGAGLGGTALGYLGHRVGRHVNETRIEPAKQRELQRRQLLARLLESA